MVRVRLSFDSDDTCARDGNRSSGRPPGSRRRSNHAAAGMRSGPAGGAGAAIPGEVCGRRSDEQHRNHSANPAGELVPTESGAFLQVVTEGELAEVQELFDAVRQACSASLWSRGVEFARDNKVHGEREDADEVFFRVATRGGLISPGRN